MTAAVTPLRRGKYLFVFRLAARQTIERRGELIGRSVFYILLLLVFSSLWNAVHEMGGLVGDPREFLWYLAITEWIALGVPLTHQTVERDVQSGDVAYFLCRPVSYLGLRIAEGLGRLAVRMAVLAMVGFAGVWLLTGSLPADPLGLVAAVPLALIAGGVIVVWGAGIGCAAFWIQDASALHWVVQKLLFVLGGLILPLSIYPDWLRRIAELLPFAAVLYGPGRLGFGFDAATFLDSALKLLVWGGLSVVLTTWIYQRSRHRLEVNGG